MVLTQIDLDAAACDDPDCQHLDHPVLFLHSSCHEDAGKQVFYDKRTGTLTICCDACQEEIAEIAVAASPQAGHG